MAQSHSPESALDALSEPQRTALKTAAPNFRDAGGLTTSSGRGTRANSLFRTGQLANLPADAEIALTALGILGVYDLRTKAERTPKPDTLPDHIQLVVADVLADSPTGGATALAALSSHDGHPPSVEEVNALIGGGKARELMHEAYRDFIRLDSANAAYREFATGVANGQGAIAFHCTAGKDRTGWGAAMLQLLVGVDTDAVVAHYLESSARTSAEFAPLVELFTSAGGDGDALRDLVDVEPDYLQTAIDLMSSTYGDIEGYFVNGLGLADHDLTALEARLLE